MTDSQSPGPVIDATAVRRQFARRADRLAQADFLYEPIAHRMAQRLEVVRMQPATVLDVGCGLGAGLDLLGERYPQATRLGVDLAEPVAQRALRPDLGAGWRRHLGGLVPGRRRPLRSALCADTTALPLAAGSIDLIWSNLCLHWVPDIGAALAEWYRVIRPEGLVMFSLFGVDTFREIREAGAELIDFPDMHDVGDLLVGAGFADPVMDTDRLTLEFSEPQALIRDLSAIGGNPYRGRFGGLRARASLERWHRALADIQIQSGGLRLTVEVCFGHAWCGQTKKRADGLAPIEFHRPGSV